MDEIFTIVICGGRSLVHCWISHQFDYPVSQFIAPNDLALFLAAKRIPLVDELGKKRSIPLFKYWFQCVTSPRAVRTVMLPVDQRIYEGQLNLWSGFTIQPKPGKWDKLYWHMKHILSSENKDVFEYMKRWCAWKLQNPCESPMVAMVLRGGHDLAKDALCAQVLDRIFGYHGRRVWYGGITGVRRLLDNAAFLFLDETVWARTKSSEAALKRLIEEQNHLAIAVSANKNWVPASPSDRCYFIADVSSAMPMMTIFPRYSVRWKGTRKFRPSCMICWRCILATGILPTISQTLWRFADRRSGP